MLDAYNANPTSMELAIRNFSNETSGSKFLILGDMHEVGKASLEEHLAIVKLIKDLGFGNVILVGNYFGSLDVPAGWMKFIDIDETKKWIIKNRITGHTILLKGSRKVGLEKITELL